MTATDIDRREAGDTQVAAEETVSRVTVIGGAGYLGSLVVDRLLDLGLEVTVMDSFVYGGAALTHLEGRERLSLLAGDLRDIEAVVQACANADAVIHLGAIVGDPACALDEELTFSINRDATLTVARVARALGVRRFIFASTCSVYGATDELLTEESPVAPLSLYARSKAESEELILPMARPGFSPTVLRFGTFFGHSHRERFDLIVNLLAAKAATDGEFTITGGDQWRPFVHVADGADSVVRCLLAPEAAVSSQVFNIGSQTENRRLTDVAALIAEMVPGSKVVYAPAAATEASYRVSFDRIAERVGWRATRTLEEGIAEVRASVERGSVTDYSDAQYSNYKALVSGSATISRDPVLDGATVGAPIASVG